MLFKKALVISLSLFVSASLFGQFHIGPQIGYTASNLSVNRSSVENGLRNNFVAGVFARIGKKIYLQPEVNWLTQGSVFKYSTLDDPSPVEQTIKLSTVQVPVSLGWRIINLEIVNIRIAAGATANFLMNTKIDTKNGDGTEYLIPDDFKKTQWQWQGGVGVDVLMFAFDVRYFGGINDILNKDITIDSDSFTVSSKSNLFMVTVGWKIL